MIMNEEKELFYTSHPLKKTWRFHSSKEVRRAIKQMKSLLAQDMLEGASYMRVQAVIQVIYDLNNQVLVDMYDLEEGC